MPDTVHMSLSTAAARTLATTTKSVPHTQDVSPRWLLRALPWVGVEAGTFRTNRRLAYPTGESRVAVRMVGGRPRVVAAALAAVPLFRGLDEEVLDALADRFVARQVSPGKVLAAAGQRATGMILIGHGKADQVGVSEYGAPALLGTLADGDHVGAPTLVDPSARWEFGVRALTPCTVLTLARTAFREVLDTHEALRSQVASVRSTRPPPQNRRGEAVIALLAGHTGEPTLPATFVDYEPRPREYGPNLAQTMLRVHTRVAGLYNHPMDQTEQQLRLTVDALREQQEHELINNPSFGLLARADLRQWISARGGPPTPDDLDLLLTRRRKTRFLLAHPRTIAAFGRECTHRGIRPSTMDYQGARVRSWRGVPLLPCDKIPVTGRGSSSILACRTGMPDQGVIGLYPASLPDEHAPGLSVRSTDVNPKAVSSYLLSLYFSVAVLVPDALGVLERVEVGR